MTAKEKIEKIADFLTDAYVFCSVIAVTVVLVLIAVFGGNIHIHINNPFK